MSRDREIDRWVAVGRSSDADSARAGWQAVSEALVGDDPKLLVVFCSEAHDLPALLAAVREQSGSVPLIGCSTAGEIASTGLGNSSVVITALGGAGFHAATAAGRDASARLREAGTEAASCVSDANGAEHKVLLLLTDGLAGDQQEIVRGAYSEVGAVVPLVGGCAGDDLRMQATHQMLGDEVLTDSVVAAALSSDSPMGIGVRHGWQRVGEPMLVTRSSQNRVITIDEEPALDAYLDRLDAPGIGRAHV